MTQPPRLSEIRGMPVLYFIPFVVLGVLLYRVRPASILPAGSPQWIGAAVGILAFALLAWASRHMQLAQTTHEHGTPTTALVTNGPFAWSRNPIYVALALLVIGLGLHEDNLWLLAMVVPPILLLDRYVVRREEAYLESLFGATYREYRSTVRRWL